MIYNYRCGQRGCRKRITLKHPLEWYIRPPKCKGACLGTGQLNFDAEVPRRHRAETCRCSGVHFPHRRGTVVGPYEFCHSLSIEAVSLKLMRWDGIEPAGPFTYIGHEQDEASR